jgi:hypothetical protein
MYGVVLCCCRWPVLSKRLPGTKGGVESAGRSTRAIWKAVKESAAAPRPRKPYSAWKDVTWSNFGWSSAKRMCFRATERGDIVESN